MSNYKIDALTKILNSSLITNIYPMVKDVKVDIIDREELSAYIHLTIFVDDDITYHNMYEKEFDPHYMVDYHIKNILPYFSLTDINVEWDVYTTSGRYVTGIKLIGFGNAIYCRPDKDGNKLCN